MSYSIAFLKSLAFILRIFAVFTMSMKVKNKQNYGGVSNNVAFYLRMRQKSFEDKYQTMEIFEADGWWQDPMSGFSIDDTKLPPGLTMGSQIGKKETLKM